MTDVRTNAELTEVTASGLRWIALARVLTEVLLLVSMVWLARLIPPSAFGMFAIAVIVQELAINVPSEGVSSALVQRRSIGRPHLQGGLALSLLIGLALALVMFLVSATLVDAIYGRETAELVALTTPWFLLGSLVAVPMAVLRRKLDFRRLSILALTQSVVRSVASLVLALAFGLDAAALVLGGIAGIFAMTMTALAFAPVPLPRWHGRAIRELLDYGAPAALASLSWVGFRNGDYAVVGARLGAVQAGIYWRGFQLAVEYQGKISAVMAQVAFPVLSRTTDADAMFELRHRMVRLLTVVTFPLLGLLVILAPVLIPFLFGPEWEEAVLPTQILAGAGAATVAIDAVGATLMAAGRARALLGYGFAHFAVYVGAILLVASRGLAAVSIAAVSVHVVFLVVAYRMLAHGRPQRTLRLLWDDIAPAVIACAALIAFSWPVEAALSEAGAPPVPNLACVGIVAAAAYLGALRMWCREAAHDLAMLVRRLVGGRRMPSAARRVLRLAEAERHS